MRTTPREGEAFYNEKLSRELRDIYKKSQVGVAVLSQLIDCSRPTTNAYVCLQRSIVRSDVERRVVVTISLLTKMVNEGILPLDLKRNDKTAPDKIMAVINDYLDSIDNSAE